MRGAQASTGQAPTPGGGAPERGAAPRGFILLPVTLLLSLVAAMAFLGHRETGLASAMASATDQQDKARYAAEAGLQRTTVQMHTKGCAGSYPVAILGPMKDSAFDGASYYAYSWPLSGSPVTVTSTGTYGDASVTLTRANVPVHQATTTTYTLQPASEGLDSYLDTANSTGNASKTTMVAAPGTSYPVIQFDLSTVPAGSHVTSAKLSLYAQSGSNNGAVAVHRMMRDWTEPAANWTSADGSAAWSTVGGDVHATAVASSTFNGGPAWMSWDITGLVDRWIKGSLPNQGVQVRAAGSIAGLTFTSSDGTTAANRPKLDITFLPPCGWVPPVVTLNPIADTDIDANILLMGSNFGSDPTLYLSKGNEARPLLKFDVSGIAPGRSVKTAMLRVYFDSLVSGTKLSKNLTANVYEASKPWLELEATWLIRLAGTLWLVSGGDIVTTAIATKTLAQNMTPGQWVEFPVTAQVQSWIDGVTPNNGLQLRITTLSTEELIFNSREATVNRPELVVTFN